ncbi:hypothetical protein EVAR_31850_1 [Eumeta japonica]|uniref:Uncharacterized protein n=1 Tax=Eumeta variegata TaxID=151549 RepID=A0A4C1Z5V0_EUMVA|nr:hypothetical protein EVAR_31850_1 [Eumeta japonica]
MRLAGLRFRELRKDAGRRTWSIYRKHNFMGWDFQLRRVWYFNCFEYTKNFADKSQNRLAYHSNPVTTPNEITGGEELAIAGDELATVRHDGETRIEELEKFRKNNRKRLEKEQKSKAEK